jgi:hypothetical protein
MNSSYLFHLTYKDRGLPLLGTLFSTVFCDTALLVMVFGTLDLSDPKSLLMLLASFLLPFLLFAASGAVLADRIPKRGAVILGKILEFAAMCFAVFVFSHDGQNMIFAAVFLSARAA